MTAKPDARKNPKMIQRRDETTRERGRAAARKGLKEDDCPYTGWQGGYRARWLEGVSRGDG